MISTSKYGVQWILWKSTACDDSTRPSAAVQNCLGCLVGGRVSSYLDGTCFHDNTLKERVSSLLVNVRGVGIDGAVCRGK